MKIKRFKNQYNSSNYDKLMVIRFFNFKLFRINSMMRLLFIMNNDFIIYVCIVFLYIIFKQIFKQKKFILKVKE